MNPTDFPSLPSAESEHPGSRAWLVVALLFPVALLNYLDRQMLATMRLSLSADFTELHNQSASGSGPPSHWRWVMSTITARSTGFAR